ncbi:uncharacterized protein LOC107036627 isoform X2 [Diachasma alloeum]|uniref:uncharacterized protein LOC107036627 isoform X2 n=1 Tax=Diachasma alloeum TaxID=454923 RepID=UPI0007384CC2|nr:uncharacterized protein LOC107036627 isoform X2 [Diachasma alloeum]
MGWENKGESTFERKVAELAVSPVMTEHCQNYFENLLKDHKAYQARLSENITKATYHWNLGLYNLYYKFTIARQLIGTLERKVSDCHSVRLTKNEINSYRCLIGIAQEAEMLKNQIVESIYKHMTSLTEVKDSSLISLHQSINGSLIPPVFDEAAMDKWLALHCPEGS